MLDEVVAMLLQALQWRAAIMQLLPPLEALKGMIKFLLTGIVKLIGAIFIVLTLTYFGFQFGFFWGLFSFFISLGLAKGVFDIESNDDRVDYQATSTCLKCGGTGNRTAYANGRNGYVCGDCKRFWSEKSRY